MRTLRTDKLPLASSEDVVAVRQTVRMQAQSLGFSLVDQTKLVTAASEIARNTVLYGGGGVVEIEGLENAPRRGGRLTFEDHGPGIADLAQAMRDGYTTGGGPAPRRGLPRRRHADDRGPGPRSGGRYRRRRPKPRRWLLDGRQPGHGVRRALPAIEHIRHLLARGRRHRRPRARGRATSTG